MFHQYSMLIFPYEIHHMDCQYKQMHVEKQRYGLDPYDDPKMAFFDSFDTV